MNFYNQLHELSGVYDIELRSYSMLTPEQVKPLTNPAAWGIPDGLAHQLDFLGCETLIIVDEEKSQRYWIPFTLFTDVGRYRHVGDMVVLYAPVRYWAVEKI